MKNQPNNWNELLEAGYVSDLTDWQVEQLKEIMNPILKLRKDAIEAVEAMKEAGF